MDFGTIFARFWASLSQSLGGEALALVFTVGMVAALVSLWLGVAAFRKTEFYKQHRELWDLVDDKIADLIFMVEFGDIDLEPYYKRAEERKIAGLSDVDPRMLYLLDKADDLVKDKLGVQLDFEELLARAEHIFNEIKNDQGNSVGE